MRSDWDVPDDRVTSGEWSILERIFGTLLHAGDPDTLQQAVETLRQLRKTGVDAVPIHGESSRSPRAGRSMSVSRRTGGVGCVVARYAAAIGT
jgi:hypothetical protein